VTKIKITTSQNIEIEYELASIFDRILAWLIDIVIIAVYVIIASLVVSIIVGGFESGPIALASLPGLFYHFICEWFFSGQSVGKMALRIKVVKIDGSPPNVGNFVLRWIFRLIEGPAVFYGAVAIAAIAFSPRGQRFGDMIAGTTVIKIDRKVSLADTIYAPSKEGYQALFPEVARLDDTDAGTIRDVLQQQRMEGGNPAVLVACANRVCHVLDIKPPQNMNAEQFLRFVLKDYSHLHLTKRRIAAYGFDANLTFGHR
jgi:uncharacterized RDD family membrane protein YckC